MVEQDFCKVKVAGSTPVFGSKMKSFEIYENIGIGIPNPKTVAKVTGSPEDLERLLAFSLQSGLEVHGLTEEEKQKYLNLDVDI